MRYGFKNDRYLDWSITLNARLGDLEEFKDAKDHLERRTLERVDVSDSAIRRHVFNPYQPDQPPTITRIVELRAGDHDRVDFEYQRQLNGLVMGWQQKHGAAAQDRHNAATTGFISKDRDRDFREGADFGWVRNTVVSLDTDLADMVIADRAGFYFPQTPSTAGVWMPDGVMKFIRASPGGKLAPEQTDAAITDDSQDGPMAARGDTTMGMLVQSIYAGDWTDQVDDLLKGD
ncbi:hypothetical protein A5784_12495 [Mycobacterium sp. 852013-50091_SCH5140682]|nr:hypothetical protein A5784_12495 [Mycobacterium sp. 852013-50091_SCH5140682]